MFTDLHWIDTGSALRLAIAARPRSGDWLDDEIANWSREGIARVVSLLEDHEITDLGLETEPEVCEKAGIIFRSFAIADRSVPSDRQAALAFAQELAQSSQPTVIHCRAGIGRSSLMAAMVLISLGMDAERAFEEIGTARRLPVPDTEAQRDWVMALSEAGQSDAGKNQS